MNVRTLDYILAVAKFGHFGQAAEHCNVSQPALSTQIKKFEDELGVTIFERDNRNVRITAVGQEIIALSGHAVETLDKIRHKAMTAQDPLSGQFRLGLIPTIAPYLLPYIMGETRFALPRLNLSFREDITDRLNGALLEGEIDAAILATPAEDNRLTTVPLYDEPFWVVFNARHRLRLAEHIRVEDLPDDELLLLTEGHCFRDQALDVCGVGSAQTVRSVHATSLETLINLVQAGQGITLVPAMAVSEQWEAQRGLKCEKLENDAAYRRIYLTYRKSFPRGALIEKLAELIMARLPGHVQHLG